jgi:hypothetical protein
MSIEEIDSVGMMMMIFVEHGGSNGFGTLGTGLFFGSLKN